MTAFDRMKALVERWEPHREGLLKAIARLRGTHDEADVLHMIFSGRAKLITSKKTAVVAEILTYPQFRELNVFLLAGDLLDVIAQEPGLEQEARALGCKRLRFEGRDEWRAIMKDRPDGFTGFKPQTVFYKDL